jgi:hypothetical protein
VFGSGTCNQEGRLRSVFFPCTSPLASMAWFLQFRKKPASDSRPLYAGCRPFHCALSSNVRVGDYLGATRKTSDPSSIHVELGIVGLDSSELYSCRKVLSMAKLAPITMLTEPIGSILRLAELADSGDCSA